MESNGFNKHPENINRNGPPKKDNSWRAIMEKVAEEQHKAENQTLTKKELITKVLFSKGLKGDLKAIEIIINRMDGQPKQSVEQVGAINIKYEDNSDSDI